ncbi:MAG: hypothetical protein RR107_06485, partial [Clostridia bacterium]
QKTPCGVFFLERVMGQIAYAIWICVSIASATILLKTCHWQLFLTQNSPSGFDSLPDKRKKHLAVFSFWSE